MSSSSFWKAGILKEIVGPMFWCFEVDVPPQKPKRSLLKVNWPIYKSVKSLINIHSTSLPYKTPKISLRGWFQGKRQDSDKFQGSRYYPPTHIDVPASRLVGYMFSRFKEGYHKPTAYLKDHPNSVSNWLLTTLSKSPKYGCYPSKFPFHGL